MADAVEMPRVKLGSQGLEVSKLGFGCMGLTGAYSSPVPEEEGIAIIKEAFSKGVTFFDSSDVYGTDHANEYLIGKLATKFGIYKIEPTKVTVKGTPEYVRSCCEASLKCLQVDYIDLYYVHRIDTTVPIEETMGELKKLVEEGKIKYIGLSEAHPETIRRAHAVHPITAVQQEYSLWTRDVEDDIIPVCRFLYTPLHILKKKKRFETFYSLVYSLEKFSILSLSTRELGIGIVPYSPVGRGLFAGKAVIESLPANSFLTTQPRFTGENFEKNESIYFHMEGVAKKHGCSPAQLAISWVLHQGDDIVPIPGTTKIKNLHDNIGSVRVKLTEEDVNELSDAVPASEVAGQRIGEALYKSSYKFSITPPQTK